MGCTQSSADTRLQTVDDSVHVMLAHDKKVQKQKGEKPHGYVPRAAHPLLNPIPVTATEPEGDGGGETKAATPEDANGGAQ